MQNLDFTLTLPIKLPKMVVWALCLTLCSMGALSCSDAQKSSDGSTEKLLGDYNEDPFGDGYGYDEFEDTEDPWSTDYDDQTVIDEFLSMDLGEEQAGDLTNGEVLVAGPGSSVQVVLSCSQGTLYVAAGAAVGTLATVFAASGVLAGGVGVGATAPASVPLYAAAGGLIGLAASSGSWTQCLTGLANLGIQLAFNGYLSVARGLRGVIQRPQRQQAVPGTNSTTANSECQGGGRQCRQMHDRYKDFCDPLEEATEVITGRWDGGLCTQEARFFNRYSCTDLMDFVWQAAGCEAGRRLVTNRCYGGNWDQGHIPPHRNAKNQLRNCSNLFKSRCGDLPDTPTITSDAENQYPECR